MRQMQVSEPAFLAPTSEGEGVLPLPDQRHLQEGSTSWGVSRGFG